ncbi:MAG: hypothetical protein KC505_02410 [Myxococcales bacterium]|nr:hypothetical protein [Myxococcales bacterium]USN51758.1 MAG: hypothetical protein H6731_04950 [Myxococcales bacterium]
MKSFYKKFLGSLLLLCFFSHASFAQSNSCRFLHESVKTNNLPMVIEILHKTKARADCEDHKGNTAVHHFARYGKDYRILVLLMYRGFGTLNKVNHAMQTPAMVALDYKNQKSLTCMFALSSDFNPIRKPDGILR